MHPPPFGVPGDEAPVSVRRPGPHDTAAHRTLGPGDPGALGRND